MLQGRVKLTANSPGALALLQSEDPDKQVCANGVCTELVRSINEYKRQLGGTQAALQPHVGEQLVVSPEPRSVRNRFPAVSVVSTACWREIDRCSRGTSQAGARPNTAFSAMLCRLSSMPPTALPSFLTWQKHFVMSLVRLATITSGIALV